MPQPLGGELARGVAGKAERIGDRRAEQRIAERVQDQREGAFGDMMLLVADGQLGDEAADRIEDRVQRVAVAGEDHPRGERAGAFLAERVEGLVDDVARVGLPGAGALDRLGDAGGDRIGDRARKLALKPGGRAEMMEQIGVGPADLRRDRLQGHGRRALGEQQLARGLRARRSGFLPGSGAFVLLTLVVS